MEYPLLLHRLPILLLHHNPYISLCLLYVCMSMYMSMYLDTSFSLYLLPVQSRLYSQHSLHSSRLSTQTHQIQSLLSQRFLLQRRYPQSYHPSDHIYLFTIYMSIYLSLSLSIYLSHPHRISLNTHSLIHTYAPVLIPLPSPTSESWSNHRTTHREAVLRR